THSDLFVTMWYAIWNPANGSLSYASAGHNPPLVINAGGGSVQKLRLKGIALGVLDSITLGSARITLVSGDTLVMYTDGITEAHDADDVEFGTSGLEIATRTYCAGSAEDTLRGIITALDRHTGIEPQFDDLTLVVVRRA
ncbi:MAG: serine/threonine-protein phosphatase, partial [Anaerolineae bacterium]|nr:serine/threonine-protein phosphatase [Anaerolineae bacterium]